MASDLKQPLRQFLNDLDGIAAKHPDLKDTDVRESIWWSIRNLLIVPQPGYQIPSEFEMQADDANAAVAEALQRFLTAPAVVAVAKQHATPVERLATLQDDSVRSTKGSSLKSLIGLWDYPR